MPAALSLGRIKGVNLRKLIKFLRYRVRVEAFLEEVRKDRLYNTGMERIPERMSGEAVPSQGRRSRLFW